MVFLLHFFIFVLLCLSFISLLSVKEVPAQANAQGAFVQGVVGGEEIFLAAAARIDVAHHHEEACVLEVEVGIDVHNRIAAHLHSLGTFLNGELAKRGTIVGSVVLGEVAHVATHVAAEHLGNFKPKEEIGINIEVGNGKHILFR